MLHQVHGLWLRTKETRSTFNIFCTLIYLQALKQELIDTRDEHNRDLRELEMTQNELIKELKRLLLIIDNFVPIEVKTRLYTQSRYDEEQEEWTMNTAQLADTGPVRRPISVPTRRRPVSEYASQQMKEADTQSALHRSFSHTNSCEDKIVTGATTRFMGENILAYELDMPVRTTHDYKNPKVSASLQAVLAEAMQSEDEIDIAGEQVYAVNK